MNGITGYLHHPTTSAIRGETASRAKKIYLKLGNLGKHEIEPSFTDAAHMPMTAKPDAWPKCRGEQRHMPRCVPPNAGPVLASAPAFR